MVSIEFLRKIFDSDAWGTRGSLASLRSIDGMDTRPAHVLGHIVGAQRIWLARLEQEVHASLAVRP